ncbi:MAG: MopE-related protein, partial [Myxococcota bacterium]
DDFDQDADGTALGQGDCDDTDPAFGPDAVDVSYDGIDHDCAGDNDYDADHDGAVALGFEAEIGGTAPRTGDCDDQAPGVHPLRDEVFYDGIDQDCSPANDDDADGDGVASTAVGGTDCNDLDPAVRPGVAEVWYDGVDQDCSGGSDFDQDGDGVHSALDPFVQGVPDACDTVPGPYQDASFVQIDAGDDPVAVLGALCPGGDVLDIQLASGTFVLTDEIVLDARNVSISGSSGTVLLGSGGHRLLHLTPSVESLYLADLEGAGGDTPGDGGCVWMENPTESTRLELYRTVFRECHADGSGGVFTAGGFADITVVESEFERNSARRGGVFHSADAYFDVQDSTFGGNTAECGGSIDTNGYSYVRFRDLRFVGDHATERGGSLNLGGAVQIDQWENLEFVGPRTDSRAAAFFIGPETGSGGFGTSVLYGTTVRGAQAPVTNGGAEAAVEIYDQRLDLYDLAILGGRATNGLLLYGYDSGGFGAGGGSYRVTGLVVDGLSAYHSVRTHGGELFLDHVRVAGQSRPPSSELAYVDPVLDSPCDRDDDGFELPGGTYGPHEVLDCVYTFPVEPYEAPQPCDPWFGCDIAQESCGAAIRLTGDAQTYVEAHFVTATANATPHQLVVIDPEQNGMGAVVLSELVLGSASAFYDRAGLLMGDYTDFGFSDIRNVHGVHGNAFRRIPSEDPTPIGSNSTLSADDPFLAPHPATDGHLDPAHPVASAGDPSVCSVWDPPECPMPGFWGGPAW